MMFLLKVYSTESAFQFPALKFQNPKFPCELPGRGTVHPMSALASPLLERFSTLSWSRMQGCEGSGLVCYHAAGTIKVF